MKPNRILTISTVEQFLRWWPFFVDGLKALRDKAKWKMSPDEFFRCLLQILGQDEDTGMIVVLVSGGGQPLGFLALCDSSHIFAERRAEVFALYSNNKDAATFVQLLAEGEQWARGAGYTKLVAASFRFSQAANRWFSGKLKFEREAVLFTKGL